MRVLYGIILSLGILFSLDIVFDIPLVEAAITSVSIPKGSGVPGCELNCYSPVNANVKVGDTVTWTNIDSAAHTVTSGSPSPAKGSEVLFDSGIMMPGQNFSFKFDQVGTFKYHCMIHPGQEGTVVVSKSPRGEVKLSTISVKADKSSYSPGDIITVSGTVRSKQENTPITMTVLSPVGNIVKIERLTVGNDLKFGIEFDTLGKQWKSFGKWTVKVMYGDPNLGDSTTFQMNAAPPTPSQADPDARISAPVSAYVDTFVAFSGMDSFDTDGIIVDYDWSFADDRTTSNDSAPKHSFSNVGSYWITLTVTDDDGLTDTEQFLIKITENPIEKKPINFKFTPQQAPGIISPGESIPEGKYGVKITDSAGGTSRFTEFNFDSVNGRKIIKNNEPPEAIIEISSTNEKEKTVTFSGATSYDIDGNIEGYEWSFGDGTTSTEEKPTHQYGRAGNYEVELLVYDNQGEVGQTTTLVTVPNQLDGWSPESTLTIAGGAAAAVGVGIIIALKAGVFGSKTTVISRARSATQVHLLQTQQTPKVQTKTTQKTTEELKKAVHKQTDVTENTIFKLGLMATAVDASEAEQIVLSPTEKLPIDETQLHEVMINTFQNHVLKIHDSIVLSTHMGGKIQFIVTSTKPAKSVIVTKNTIFKLGLMAKAVDASIPRITYDDLGSLTNEGQTKTTQKTTGELEKAVPKPANVDFKYTVEVGFEELEKAVPKPADVDFKYTIEVGFEEDEQ